MNLDISPEETQALPKHLRKMLIQAINPLEFLYRPLDLDSCSPSTKAELVKAFFSYADKEVCRIKIPKVMETSLALQVMKKLFWCTEFNSEYVKYFNEKSRNFIFTLLADPGIFWVANNWGTLSMLDRKSVLLDISAAQDAIFSREHFSFSLGEIIISAKNPGMRDGGAKSLGQAFDKDGVDAISINPDPKKGWNDFAVVLGTLVHEKIHIHQVQISRAWKAGNLSPNDPFFCQGQLFHDYFFEPEDGVRLVFTHPTDMALNFAKPFERHAYVTSTDIVYAVVSGDVSTVIEDFPLDGCDRELAKSWRTYNRYPLGWDKLTT